MQPSHLRVEEGIVYAPRNRGISDERTEMNEPLVYGLYRQVECPVAMFGMDNL
jgi:hypothetical protein